MKAPKKKDYVDYIEQVVRENYLSARNDIVLKRISDEITEFINDVIDLLPAIPKAEAFVRSAKWNFIVTNLMPASYGIYLNFLAGNVPVCFMQLRNTLEFMAECYLADRHYPDEKYFHQKLLLLENRNRQQKKPLSRVIKDVDRRQQSFGTSVLSGYTL